MLNSNNFSSMQLLIAYPWDIKNAINTKLVGFLFLLSCATKMQFECEEITQFDKVVHKSWNVGRSLLFYSKGDILKYRHF